MDTPNTMTRSSWDALINSLLDEFEIYAPFLFGEHLEYAIVSSDNAGQIVYNRPKPSTPLKQFFLPVRENVIHPGRMDQKRIILGSPACDLSGLSLLDEIYLDEDYIDPNYALHRNNTLLIGFDCHSVQEHCHCTSYGFSPVPEENSDLVVSLNGTDVLITIVSEKGKAFQEKYLRNAGTASGESQNALMRIRDEIKNKLVSLNRDLPDYERTGLFVSECDEKVWDKYAEACVSCGACSAICPTCSCFLFIERPEFEKVRSIDTCQYPGFERVAAGEDPLRPLSARFRNRYMCKYVWKPDKYNSKACTGCGRCIETCIGEINKNELFVELNKTEKVSG
jgi:ferredoxin